MVERDFIVEMRARVLRHVTTSLLGVFGAFLLAGIVGGVVAALDLGSAKRFVLGAVVMSAVVIAPVVGIRSARRNLRCPGCEGALWGMSAFGRKPFDAKARQLCPHCGVRLFAPRRMRVIVLLVVAGAVLVIAGAAASVLARR
ncbi:MAG TPA: hypothetical protein VG755_45240 [Nannocystaceae bacterium]|nr:hypothetical protein [Nannocystaceae bacterium]